MFAIQILAQATLAGRVTDSQGEPLAGASVVLNELRDGTFTDGEGRYQFENLAPRKYNVEVTFVGYEVQTGTTNVPENYAGSVLMHFQLEEKTNILDEVVVQATRAGKHSPFTYSTMKKEELESQNLGQDVPMLLDAMPSVVVNSDAGAGFGYTGLRIRGTDPTRINVTINGIPLNDAESQGVFWVDLPDFASSTEDIQVQRGVGTSTNGAGAFGATINLSTSKLRPEAYGELAGTLGSFGTRKATVNFGTGLLGSPQSAVGSSQSQGFTLDGRLSKIVSDGYIDRASVDLESFYLSGAFFGKNNSLRANVFSGHEVTYQAWNGVPAQYVDDDELRKFNVSGTEKSLDDPHPNEVDDYTQTHYQLLYTHELNRNLKLNLAGHWTRGFGFFEQYKSGESIPDDYGLAVCDTCFGAFDTDLIRRRWLDNDFYGGTWSLAYATNGQQLQTTLGGAWNRYEGDHFGEIIWAEYSQGIEQGERYYFGTGDKQDFNVFMKTQYSFTPYLHGFLDLQYRRVGYEITGTDNDLRETNADLTYNFFNPKAGLTFDFSENASAYASFAVANREPNRSDFTDAAPGAEPKPERLLNTEAGVRFRQGKGTFGANVYHMRYQDQLALTGNINDVGGAIRVNVPDSYRLGLELVGNYALTDRLTLDANATFSRNKIENFTEYIDNWDTWEQEVIEHGTTDIALSPDVIAFGKLSYLLLQNDKHDLTASLTAKHVGEQFIDNTSNSNTVLEAYTVSGLQLIWTVRPDFVEEISFNLLVNNILDTKYSANAWAYRYISEGYDGREFDPYTRLEGGATYNLTGFYPQAGRNFLIGISVKF